MLSHSEVLHLLWWMHTTRSGHFSDAAGLPVWDGCCPELADSCILTCRVWDHQCAGCMSRASLSMVLASTALLQYSRYGELQPELHHQQILCMPIFTKTCKLLFKRCFVTHRCQCLFELRQVSRGLAICTICHSAFNASPESSLVDQDNNGYYRCASCWQARCLAKDAYKFAWELPFKVKRNVF